MSSARDPEDVLASIRRLVAREVSDAQDRETAERPAKDEMPVFSARASAAARMVLRADEPLAANGAPAQPAGDAAPSRPSAGPEPVAKAGFGTGGERPSRPDAEHLDLGAAASTPVAAESGVLGPMTEDQLRAIIREILREEVRERMGPRINQNIRRIVQSELAQLFSEDSQ